MRCVRVVVAVLAALLATGSNTFVAGSMMELLRNKVRDTEFGSRILGAGTRTTHCAEPYSFTVRITNPGSFIPNLCSGFLIAPDIVVTAAICLNSFVDPDAPANSVSLEGLMVNAADPRVDLADLDEASIAIEKVWIHSGFNVAGNTDAGPYGDNLAILKLASSFTPSDCITMATMTSGTGSSTCVTDLQETCSILGWGSSSLDNDFANGLPIYQPSDVRELEVTMTTNARIVSYLVGANYASETNYADSENGVTFIAEAANGLTCMNDWGSPLVCSDGAGGVEVKGILLTGSGCNRGSVLSVYPAVDRPMWVLDLAQYRSLIDACQADIDTCGGGTLFTNPTV